MELNFSHVRSSGPMRKGWIFWHALVSSKISDLPSRDIARKQEDSRKAKFKKLHRLSAGNVMEGPHEES
jgi:hypothetical protein